MFAVGIAIDLFSSYSDYIPITYWIGLWEFVLMFLRHCVISDVMFVESVYV